MSIQATMTERFRNHTYQFFKEPAKEPAMPQFTLTRTGLPPASLVGESLGSVSSINAGLRDRETSAVQWFVVDLYRTQAGTYVAHVQYRAGSRLGREHPVDRVWTAGSAEAILANLGAISAASEFVRGWPGAGEPDANRGKDFTAQHKSVCQYAGEQWRDVLGKLRGLLGFSPVAAEEII